MQLKTGNLLALALGALALATPVFAADPPKPKPQDEAAIEAKLEAARGRLEEAAREVAELSSQLTGPMVHDFMIRRPGSRAMLGVTLASVSESSRDGEGVAIESVTPGGPASDAGLKAGDVLVSIDGKSLRRAGDGESGGITLVRHMRGVKPGDKVKVEYLRDGKTQKADITTEVMDMQRFARRFSQDGVRAPPVPGMPALPPMPHEPFAMAFRGFRGHGLHDMELVALTPKLGQYFGTDKGVLVVRAPTESELKLEEGDVIVDIDGRAPQSGSHAMRILRSYQPGEKINVNVLRNRKAVKLQYTLPQRDAIGDAFGDMDMFWKGSSDNGDLDVEVVTPAPPAPPRAPAGAVEST